MGILPMDDDTISRVKALAARAARRENWYRPGDAAIPGDSPTYREQVGTYRLVFTWTVEASTGRVFRHMSLSCRTGKVPAPEVYLTLAHWLGYTGATPNKYGFVETSADLLRRWYVNFLPHDRCVVVGEQVEGEQSVLGGS